MKNCTVDYNPPPPHQHSAWCESHEKEATHCSPDGNGRVCEDYAKAQGCSCCVENYPENFVTIRIREANLRGFLATIAPIAIIDEIVKFYFGDLNDVLPEPRED